MPPSGSTSVTRRSSTSAWRGPCDTRARARRPRPARPRDAPGPCRRGGCAPSRRRRGGSPRGACCRERRRPARARHDDPAGDATSLMRRRRASSAGSSAMSSNTSPPAAASCAGVGVARERERAHARPRARPARPGRCPRRRRCSPDRSPSARAACRKRSGAGLPCATSVALKIRPSKRSHRPGRAQRDGHLVVRPAGRDAHGRAISSSAATTPGTGSPLAGEARLDLGVVALGDVVRQRRAVALRRRAP